MPTRLRILAFSLPWTLLPVYGQAEPGASSSYVALNAKGKKTAPKAGARPHPCVLDTATGLVWAGRAGLVDRVDQRGTIMAWRFHPFAGGCRP